MKSYSKYALFSVVLVSLALSAIAQADGRDAVLIRCEGDCSKAVRAVQKAGGLVTHRYKYVDAIAAKVPGDKRRQISSSNGVAEISKDVVIREPKALEQFDLESTSDAVASSAIQVYEDGTTTQPDGLWFNLEMMGADQMFGLGYWGDGAITAIIDSGTSHHPAFNRGGCVSADPTVVGGETYIGGADPTEPSATSYSNGNHGTWVGTTIAANVLYTFSAGLTAIVADHAPGSVWNILGTDYIPMVGPAPCSNIYALKVFSAFGGGAPSSDVLAAMERAITLKSNFDAGMPSAPVSGDGSPEDPFVYDSLNIQVVNMSLGGGTLYAGMDLDDQLTLAMLDANITIVNSAGNEGFAAMTGGSAGTGLGTLTAGAASSTQNERILRDLQYGAGVGDLYRPSSHTQMATFSSRGPSADGRISTDAVANGFAVFAGYANGSCCALVSGTSFSAPNIAGAAALLRGAMPGATGLQIRNALVETANPAMLGDNSAPIDQGAGFIDIPAAYAALQGGTVSNDLPVGESSASVSGNIDALGFETITIGNSGSYQTHLADLAPGQVAHLFLDSKKTTDQFTIKLTNITPALPPAEQNAFFGDDIYVKVQDSRTSDEDYPIAGFVASDVTLVMDNPGTGIVRLAVMGDWTNAGTISLDVEIMEVRSSAGKALAKGNLPQSYADYIEIEVPEGTSEATFELAWNNHWGRYPTDDLDLVLFHTAYGYIWNGATFASPERVVISAPIPGTFWAIIDGYTVWGVHGGAGSKYELRAWDQDGNSF